jgi:hypothetical protein
MVEKSLVGKALRAEGSAGTKTIVSRQTPAYKGQMRAGATKRRACGLQTLKDKNT